MPKYTNKEQQLLTILADGRRHAITKLVSDDIGGVTDDVKLYKARKRALGRTVSNMRPKLAGQGYWIVCEYEQRKFFYRLVRLVSFRT